MRGLSNSYALRLLCPVLLSPRFENPAELSISGGSIGAVENVNEGAFTFIIVEIDEECTGIVIGLMEGEEIPPDDVSKSS